MASLLVLVDGVGIPQMAVLCLTGSEGVAEIVIMSVVCISGLLGPVSKVRPDNVQMFTYKLVSVDGESLPLLIPGIELR